MTISILHSGFDNYFAKSSWIAVSTLLVVYAFTLLMSDGVKRRKSWSRRWQDEREPLIGDQTRPMVNDDSWLYTHEHRLALASQAARDAFLMLFAATLVTQAGYGITYATGVLSWIFFSLSLIWILLTLTVGHPFPSMLAEVLSFPFILAIFALAFRDIDGNHGDKP